jgi:hypothetical protein
MTFSKVTGRQNNNLFNIHSSSGMISAAGLDYDQIPSRIAAGKEALLNDFAPICKKIKV